MNAGEINVFDIQRFSWIDGPGIRTVVYFKGCNMDCFWCHNPESKTFDKNLFFYEEKCILCGKCVTICPEGCHYFTEKVKHVLDRKNCAKCGKCSEVIKAGTPFAYVCEFYYIARERKRRFYKAHIGCLTGKAPPK